MSTVQAIRTVLFYLLLSASAFVWGTLSFFIAPILPFRARYRFVVQNWCRFAIWLTRVVAGIRYEVRGLENIPEKPCVILSKHQSTWETFFLSGFFEPLSQVLKRELLYVPFFGWALALLKPIAIDRSQPKLALKQLAKQGDECLKKGAWVLIFPEGTRIPVGQMGKFSRGGTALAVNAGLPVLPIAHKRRAVLAQGRLGQVPGHHPGGDRPGHARRRRRPARHRRAKPARRSLGQRDHGRDQPHPAAGQPSGAVGGLVKGRKAPCKAHCAPIR